MAEPSDYSSSSEDDEYSDALEVAASAGARLSTPEKASISRKRKVQTNPAEKLYPLVGLQCDLVITTASEVKGADWGTQLRLHNFNEIVIL